LLKVYGNPFQGSATDRHDGPSRRYAVKMEIRKLAAILAADVVGFSRLAGADEDRTLARLRALRSDLIDPTIAVHKGRVVKRTGDGLLVEFRSVVDAVQCAVEIQNAMIERNAGVSDDRRIEFRIGIHLGDVVEESDGDLMGDGVNIAARLESIASPGGGISLSEDAYRQVRARLGVEVEDLGPTQLKNIAESVRVYALAMGRPAAPKAAPAEPKAASRTDKPSIAVLPFANMSGDPEQEYFADGISEDIITALSKLSQLFVIARNSAFAFKGKHVDLREVGKALGVRYVLEGSVRKAGSRVRITAQLIDAANSGHLWAERFDRDLIDIFDVQDDVTARIVSALSVNLPLGELQSVAAQRTDNQEAYDNFLHGRALWRRADRQAAASAKEFLQNAIALDPGFTPAHAILAIVHVTDAINGWSASPDASRQIALDCATRALALDDRSAEAHFAMAVTMLWRRAHDLALREIDRAIALDPNHSDVLSARGLILHYAGRSEEALPLFERAFELDPLYDQFLHFNAQALYDLGRYAEAGEVLTRRIAVFPGTDASRILLAACYGQMGRVEEARQQWRDALGINPGYSIEQRRKTLPYKNPEGFERVVEGLRKAGLPDASEASNAGS
jgi:adenylate cyclase